MIWSGHDYLRIAWLSKDLKVWDKQTNAKLVQLDEHQTGMAEVHSLIVTGGNIFLLIYFLYSHSKATDANIANFL